MATMTQTGTAEASTGVKFDSKGRQVGFDGPGPIIIDENPVEHAHYERRATESSRLLAALGHPIRIAILLHARPGEDYSAADLSQIEPIKALDTECSNVAHHLKSLARQGLFRPTRLTKGKRAGIKQMYEITERGEVMARVCALAEKMLAGADEVVA